MFDVRTLRKLQKAYFQIATLMDGNPFCKALNLLALVRRKSTRFGYDTDCSMYFYRDQDIKKDIYFPSKYRALLYVGGMKNRSEWLAREYQIDEIEFSPDDLVVDCGANIGELRFWEVFTSNDVRYIGFEPAPGEFFCLKKNVGTKFSENTALWNENSQLKFYIDSSNADSSLIRPAKSENEIVVTARRLDSYKLGKIRLLKLEAEGAEPEILQGLGSDLSNVDFICADLGFERGQNCESTFAPVSNFLISKGFEIVSINWLRLTVLFKKVGIEH